MELPSNKVGLVLIVVVLFVSGTIIFSKTDFNFKKPLVDLNNVELAIGRNTDPNFKSGDADTDGLTDWLEEFYRTDPQNSDTDSDGTKDGEEVSLDRDPTIAGPNDPLITRKDLLNTEVNMTNFASGTVTDKLSVELFSQYLLLKKQGALKPEDEAKMVDDISKKALETASIKDVYFIKDLTIVESSKDSLKTYGERVSQVALESLIIMDSYRNLADLNYVAKIAEEYKTYSSNMKDIVVPTVAQDIHLQLINYLYNTGVLLDSMSKTDSDPMTALVVMSQFQTIETSEETMYTSLGQYFKNNGIIFDTESVINFWKKFEN